MVRAGLKLRGHGCEGSVNLSIIHPGEQCSPANRFARRRRARTLFRVRYGPRDRKTTPVSQQGRKEMSYQRLNFMGLGIKKLVLRRMGLRALIVIALIGISVTGCAQSGTRGTSSLASQNASQSARIAAECAALGKAYSMSGKKNSGIVEGCPGYENVRSSRSNFSEAGLFLSAAGAKLPAHVAKDGDATRIYRRMISRGTPPAIAARVSKSAEFKKAVAVAKAQ